jgi:hypothetical protein
MKVAGQPPTSCGHKSVEAERLNEDANHGNYVGGQHTIWRDRGDISVLKSCAIGINFRTPKSIEAAFNQAVFDAHPPSGPARQWQLS